MSALWGVTDKAKKLMKFQVGISIHTATMETMATPFVRQGQVSLMDQRSRQGM